MRFPLAEGILSQPAPGATTLRKLTQRLSWVQETAPIDDDQPSEEAGNCSEQLPEDRELFHVRGGTPSRINVGSPEIC